MGGNSGPMIKNPFFPQKNNSQTTLAIVIESVKCVPPLLLISSSCLESCGVCDRGMVCIVSEFNPTGTTTIISLFLMGMAVAWHRPLTRYPRRRLAISPRTQLQKKREYNGKSRHKICVLLMVCVALVRTIQTP